MKKFIKNHPLKKEWKKIKKELKPLAIAIKGSTREEFPADLANLEDWLFDMLYKEEDMPHYGSFYGML